MKIKILFFACLVIATTVEVTSQVEGKNQKSHSGFNKKFRLNANFGLHWSTIEGKSLASRYFSKPSVGIGIAAEYYFKSYIGLSIGAGYQQLGSGIYTQIKQSISGLQPDSTYRTRLRFNTFVFPVTLHLRTQKYFLLDGWKFGASFSLIPLINSSTNQFYNSLEPSLLVLDDSKDVSSLYFKNDLLYQIAIGPEIISGTGIFKFQFVYSIGTANVYSSNQGNGNNRAYGIKIGYSF